MAIGDRRCWLVRAGERSRHARRFADHDIIAIGWPNVAGLEDLRSMSEQDIFQCLHLSPGIATPEADAKELLSFRDDMSIGDIVITPDAVTGDVLIGEIGGEYCYLANSPAVDYHHIRRVQWYGRWSRDLLAPDLATETKWRRTIRLLDAHQHEWSALAESVRLGEGRAVRP